MFKDKDLPRRWGSSVLHNMPLSEGAVDSTPVFREGESLLNGTGFCVGERQSSRRLRSSSSTRLKNPVTSQPSTFPTLGFDSAVTGNNQPRLSDENSICSSRGTHSARAGSTIYGEALVGLGLSSIRPHSQKIVDLSVYYHQSSSVQTGSAIKRGRKLRQAKGKSSNGDDSPKLRPLFGSSKDPDIDSLSSSSSSTEDEHANLSSHSWGDSLVQEQHQHQPSSPTDSTAMSTVSPPQSPVEQDLELYPFSCPNLRRDSTDSLSSIESSSQHWNSSFHSRRTQEHVIDRDDSSSSSTRGSSRNKEGDVGVVLPYLNLTLLRQAIATYNASKPVRETRPPMTMNLNDREAISSANESKAGESGDGKEDMLQISDGLRFGKIGNMKSSTHLTDTPSRDKLPYNPGETTAGTVAAFLAEHDEKQDLNSTFGNELGEGCQNHSNAEFSSEVEVEADNLFSLARTLYGSAAHATNPSYAYSSEGDSTFLVDTLRSVFSSASALGASFLMKDREERIDHGAESYCPSSHSVNVGGIDLEALRESYEMMIELKPRTIFAVQVTSSIEILLAKLELELAMGPKQWSEDELRAVVVLLMNPLLFEQPYQESLLRRILQILVTLQGTSPLIQWLSCLDEEGMAQLVTLFKMYLSAHFMPRPTGSVHPVICAVKGLNILYEANNIGTSRERQRQRRFAIQAIKDGRRSMGVSETTSTISYRYFYSGVMEALKYKDEYQIWREGWGKSEAERAFSFFDYPFLLSPTSKCHIINLDALTQMSAHYEDACVRHAMADHAQRLLPDAMTASARELQKGIRVGSSPYLVLELSRARLMEEAFEQIAKKHADLKKPLKVAFVDVGEEGMDQGGVTKEFFQIMVEKVFDTQFGLFRELEEGRCWWFEGSMDGSSHVQMSEEDSRIRLVEYELVGVLVGLALYNGVILGVRFPSVVYRKLLGWEVGLDSFIESFPTLGHGLEQMLAWTEGDVYDVFMREFEISYEHLGQVTTVPLMPGGESIAVTNDNREAYVHAYIAHYVHTHIMQEFEAFQRGFDKICGGRALELLRPEELELLLCGNSDLDMHDLEANCLYDDGYTPNHTLIKEFWQIVHEMTAEQHKQLLVFVTGSDRVPIRGLKDLMFVIQRNGPDSDRLPTALTCFSRLLLPEYADKDKLRERLVTAIENSNGFGLV
ncbi:hypothetical protein BGX28_003221 [Mortierella sp. GBA30]|nr:hypothetical protein BGX28_003221 [Mortierella sp. GBA30]